MKRRPTLPASAAQQHRAIVEAVAAQQRALREAITRERQAFVERHRAKAAAVLRHEADQGLSTFRDVLAELCGQPTSADSAAPSGSAPPTPRSSIQLSTAESKASPPSPRNSPWPSI